MRVFAWKKNAIKEADLRLPKDLLGAQIGALRYIPHFGKAHPCDGLHFFEL